MRKSGIFMPISALPSKYGIGGFSSEAYRFVDFLRESGQGVWQILPLCPTSLGDSPYQAPCSFAGNPYLISPEELIEDGLLTEEECLCHTAEVDPCRIDYGRLYDTRFTLLHLAFARFSKNTADYDAFLTDNSFWLYDYALFTAIKFHLGGKALLEWEPQLRHREPTVLEEYRSLLSNEIEFWIFTQFIFFKQWNKLKKYANDSGVEILGDLPIYVSADSVEVWTSPHLFMLDSYGQPLCVAGCPPDGFSPLGQLWGNPIYNWSEHKREGFEWWHRRLSHALAMYDSLRIDHFRGFESFYSIPYGAPDATGGHWERGIGRALFDSLDPTIKGKDIYAEDLGYITDGVRQLVKICGFAGMKILQFGFDSGDFSSKYLPISYEENTIVYTGTHDNPTLMEWLGRLSNDCKFMLREYLQDTDSPDDILADRLIALCQQSKSKLCIIPLYDYLHLSAEARINTPAAPFGNWSWRLSAKLLTTELAEKIFTLTKIGSRL